MSELVAALRIPVRESHAIGGISDQIFDALYDEEELFLDAIDYILHNSRGSRSKQLSQILTTGGPAWTVNTKGDGLERRVPQAAKQAMENVTSSTEAYAAELLEAWSCAYGQ